jgi:peptide/nickel transport system substrate-binding protein
MVPVRRFKGTGLRSGLGAYSLRPTGCRVAWKGLNMTLLAAQRGFTRSARAALVAALCLTLTSCKDINPRGDLATLQHGGNLSLAISEFPSNFNPLSSDSSSDYDVEIAPATYPRAFTVGADGSRTRNTDYFTGAESAGTNPQVVTYTINPKAVWSDGSPITWKDIYSEWHALSGADKAFHVDGRAGFDRVASVAPGADDRQAVITFKTPYSEWQGMFAGTNVLLPHNMTDTAEAFNNGYLNGPGLSAGPFMVSDIDQHGQRLVLVRNPRWWGRVPRLDSITYLGLDPADQLSALLDQHTIDAARVMSADDVARAKGNPGIAIRSAPEIRWSRLIYNGRPDDILAKADLRRAITMGIDREAIVNVMQRGLVDNPVPLGNHIFVAGQRCYQDNGTAGPYNPYGAREKLDELGWKLNGDMREKHGRPLVIRDVPGHSYSDSELVQLLQNNLAKIGVKLEIDWNPAPDFLTKGDFDITHDEWSSDAFPLSNIEQNYKTNGTDNDGKIGNSDLDKMIDETVTEMDPDKACELANEVDNMIWQEEYGLPLGQSPGVVAVRSDLANYGAFGMADINYTAIGFTK